MANYDKCSVELTNDLTTTLTLADEKLDSGKWDKNPIDSVDAGEEKKTIFKAWSRDDATTGPSGWVKYNLGDGTVVKIKFNVAYADGGDVSCSVSFSDEGTGTNANYTYDKSKTGDSDTSWPDKDVTWKITIKNT